MSASTERAGKVIPAQLSFLAVYNPSLGPTDETFRDQVVFYYSKAAKTRRKGGSQDADIEKELHEEENEKLRQIGLAQGMVNFAASFSNGEAVDSVETEKSRIVMHELEKGWWILASVDLTRLPATQATSATASGSGPNTEPAVEYSSREVSPPALLLQQLLRAHSIFLLHHGPSLSDLFIRLTRPKFCNIMEKFWTRFASNWDVLLHGSPAVDIYNGMKLAAGGELGIGVGEEEWGSGEREVLEHFASSTDGLVDLIVARFGEPSEEQQRDPSAKKHAAHTSEYLEPWMGSGQHPGAADGVIFSGVGAISRSSLRDVSAWMQWIYGYGDYAYGVRDNPTSTRKYRRRNARGQVSNGRPLPRRFSTGRTITPDNQGDTASNHAKPSQSEALPKGIPPPIVSAVEKSLDRASEAVDASRGAQQSESDRSGSGFMDPDVWVKYLTLGYGSSWGGKRPGTPRTASQRTVTQNDSGGRGRSEEPPLQHIDPQPEVNQLEERLKTQIAAENAGHFIIGLKGDLEDDRDEDPDATDAGDGDWGTRTLLRTLHIEVTKSTAPKSHTSSSDSSSQEPPPAQPPRQRLRVLVYVHRPFIYTLLFHPHTSTLSLPAFYRNLHTYLAPSTAPSAPPPPRPANPYTTTSQSAATPNDQPIYDLVFDPRTLTIHSSIPNIPEPGSAAAEGIAVPGLGSGSGGLGSREAPWTRVEALNVHAQILATVAGTRREVHEIERTCKTGRGWWVVWMRLPPSQTSRPESPMRDLAQNRLEDESNAEGAGYASPQRLHRETTASSTASIQAREQPPLLYSPSRSEGGDTAIQDPDPEPPSPPLPPQPPHLVPTSSLREAFLVRRARDAVPVKASGQRGASGMWMVGLGASSGVSGGAAAGAAGPRGLAEGIGVDARRYVEGLLSLSR
ncbi:hypothetical protein H2199_004788 [Coniosporium tulheliwenetii]|uniref:Uncharacterized protein n=1 Tax=Coniosporium tulheliwenetii TaxID=3383036 RepID=A0ACC2Z5B8_9PEZI|nr:hypothetical protein H2199_004788 [Cladosporium sp. JES 115]